MNLLVDIGNTAVKCAVTELGEIIAEGRDDRLTVGLLDRLLVGRDVRHAIVSSTRGDASEVVALVCSRVGHCLEFNQRTPVPIGNAYRSPETLGLDRLAAAVGAATLFPGRNVLVIDCGTALTIDTVTADGVFRGGCISPGLRMRLRALHDYTAALPLCEPSEWPEPEPNTEPKSKRKLFCGAMLYEAGLSRLTSPTLRTATPTPPIDRIGRVPGVFISPIPYIV